MIRKMKMTTKYLILICSMLFLVNMTIGLIMAGQTKTAIKTQINARMLDVANTAAAALDGDKLASVTARDTSGELYDEIIDTLRLFYYNTEATYIYTIQKMGIDQFGFILDADPKDPGEFGQSIVTTEALIKAAAGTPSVDNESFEDQWGRFYSAYCPVYTSTGELAGLVGVDFDARWYEQQITRYNISILALSIFAMIIAGVVVIISMSRITDRFRNIYDELSKLSDDINVLNSEIKNSGEFEGLIDEEDDPGELTYDINVDALGALSNKIKNMHGEMNEYLAAVRKMANTDTMTGINNRNAYNSKIKIINNAIKAGKAAFSVYITEIQQLDAIYRVLGHEYGDMVINDTVGILKNLFPEECLFRIGDAEFVAIAPEGAVERDVHDIAREMDRALSDYSSQLDDITLSVTKGYAVFDATCDREFRDTFMRAERSEV